MIKEENLMSLTDVSSVDSDSNPIAMEPQDLRLKQKIGSD